MKPVLIALFLTTAIIACGYVPFSGGKLEGTTRPNPSDWTQIAQPDIIQLETNPGDPYSVKLWIIAIGDLLYVHAGANRATWVENIEANPDVRLLIDDSIYELQAERVTDQEEFAAFIAGYESKYSTRPRNETIGEIYLYRLVSRT